MTVLDSFFILFKSDTAELEKGLASAKMRVADFEKQMGKTTDPLKVGLQEAKKSVADFERQIKESQKSTNSLGTSFVDLAAAGAAVFGVAFTGSKLVSAMGSLRDMEVELGRVAAITGVSANEISAFDATVARLSGGPAGEFTDWLKGVATQMIAMGRGDQVKNIIPQLEELADKWAGLSSTQKQFYGQQLGLTQDMVLALDKGSDSVRSMVAEQERLLPITKQSTEASKAFGVEWDNAKRGIDGATDSLMQELLPALTKILHFLNTPLKIPDWLSAILPDFMLTPTGGSGGGSSATGVNRNNPGNLRRWKGAGSSGGFATFSSAGDGLHAESENLASYDRKGLNTIRQIVSAWAPSSENNTGAYMSAVSKETGFGLDQPIDLANPLVREAVMRAINRQEGAGGAFSHNDYMTAIVGRAQSDLATAGSTSLGASGGSGGGSGNAITIGSITINTQATDADGISRDLASKLHQHFRNTIANSDDGMAY